MLASVLPDSMVSTEIFRASWDSSSVSTRACIEPFLAWMSTTALAAVSNRVISAVRAVFWASSI